MTKKLSYDFSRTENHFLDALSLFDAFLLNPLLQSHSGFTSDTSQNAPHINQGTNNDDSQVDLHPQTTVSQSQTTQVFGPDDSSDMVTGVQETPLCSLGTSSSNQRKRAPQVSHNSAVKTPLRKSGHTRCCWSFSSWRVIATLPTSSTTLFGFQNYRNPSGRQCLLSMGNQKNLNCFRINPKRK